MATESTEPIARCRWTFVCSCSVSISSIFHRSAMSRKRSPAGGSDTARDPLERKETYAQYGAPALVCGKKRWTGSHPLARPLESGLHQYVGWRVVDGQSGGRDRRAANPLLTVWLTGPGIGGAVFRRRWIKTTRFRCQHRRSHREGDRVGRTRARLAFALALTAQTLLPRCMRSRIELLPSTAEISMRSACS
jgi:hypothetical protein